MDDIYCFAIVLYELICGRVPFWASSPVQSLIMRLDQGCPPLDPRPGFSTPVGLWDVLNRMLSPNPSTAFGPLLTREPPLQSIRQTI